MTMPIFAPVRPCIYQNLRSDQRFQSAHNLSVDVTYQNLCSDQMFSGSTISGTLPPTAGRYTYRCRYNISCWHP